MEFIYSPSILDDESLLSFLVRHSLNNVYPLIWVYDALDLSKKNLQYVNAYLSREELNKIALFLNVSLVKITELTYAKYSFFHMKNNLNYRFLTMDHSRYCPNCLKEEQYHRLYWDIKPIKLCMKHRSYLVETCESCGSKILISNIINGKCKCGKVLKDNKVELCKDNVLIEQQLEVLKNLGMYYDGGIKGNDKFCLEYFQAFFKLAESMAIVRNNLKNINETFREATNYNDDLYTSYILFKIKNNLRSYFNLLLDDLNEIWDLKTQNPSVLDINKGDYSNPLTILYQSINYILHYFNQHDLLYSCLDEYFKKKYNNSFFIKRLNRYISEDKYIPENSKISINNACQLFKIPIDLIKYTFNITTRDMRIELKLKEVIDLVFSKFLSKYEVLCYTDRNIRDYITIRESYIIFNVFGMNESDIIDIIDKNNVKGIICPFNHSFGIDLVYFSKMELFPLLMQESLNNYKKMS